MRPAGPRHPPGPVPLWPIVNPGTDRGIPDSRIAREIPISFFLYPPLIIISDCKLIQSMPLLPLHFSAWILQLISQSKKEKFTPPRPR
jgi:hypothetical protein